MTSLEVQRDSCKPAKSGTGISSKQLSKRLFHRQHHHGEANSKVKKKPLFGKFSKYGTIARDDSSSERQRAMKSGKVNKDSSSTKPGLGPRPIGGEEKLGMFSGVYVPTCLNVLSILMFLRFGVILGQAGFMGIIGMLIASYIINLVTTLSLSAIASNGTVRGGGAYYLISRSLGPEFGGSIGAIFYLGFVFNTGMNAVGLIDCIKLNFGTVSGNWARVLPEGQWHLYLWSTIVLLLCTGICLGGSSAFARASNGLLVVLLIATLSIPLSALFVTPFENIEIGITYTGLSWETFVDNLKPRLTKDTAGNGQETFNNLFGILFPATGGIFAGASMSGDLKNPSKSIPKGTLYGLGTTFVLYFVVIVAMAFTITRDSFLRDTNVVQDTNLSGLIILAGELASALFSTLMGVIGSAKLLQALARDNLLPGFSIFSQGTKESDEPTNAILITYFMAQITMLCDLDQIASFVTMTYLMTFLVMNLACFLLKISSAPNFRPSFHFFNWETALFGTLISAVAMFFVDGFYATGCVGILVFIFLIIHYTSPPKSWGDVSQSLIYHQVRKYLLRLKQEHVKFWRPQILLFVNDPRRQFKLIQFCNSMKKGALYILGHVIVTDDFGSSVPEARKQQAAWSKYIDFSEIKAFVNIAISTGVEWGARNIVLSAGLGGMRPNIAVLGFYNLDDLRRKQPLIGVSNVHSCAENLLRDEHQPRIARKKVRNKSKGAIMEDGVLPTDSCKTEGMISVTSYVTILEDLLLRLQINVAVAKGFDMLEFPDENSDKKFIDLWPIQMSAEIATGGDNKQNVLTTNFDTYTLILQLGVILKTVPAWKKAYKLRVLVFVEYESDVEEERGRVESLLENLRIEAEIIVFWLASGKFSTYEFIINGTINDAEVEREVEENLKEQDWWDEIQRIRGRRGLSTGAEDLSEITSIFKASSIWPESSFQHGLRENKFERFHGLRKFLRRSKRKHTMSGITKLGVSLGMRTHRLSESVILAHPTQGSASEESASSSDDDSETDSTGSAASEADIDDFESGSEVDLLSKYKLHRRRSHSDTIRGPPPSKRSTGEKEIRVPERLTSDASRISFVQIQEPLSRKASLIPPPTSSTSATISLKPVNRPSKVPENNSTKIKSSVLVTSPLYTPQTLSKHASKPKFSSKPVPVTRVSTNDGPGPSIMFTENSPPSQHANRNRPTPPDQVKGDHPESGKSPSMTRPGSSYSTRNLPLSFNDLPCRAQHLILNELMRSNSRETAVMFTTLPSPLDGTSQSEEASVSYLGDLEILCKGCPPTLMVHSNSMTVTMSL
ncbi:Vacuolar cation-chloride cotransporter 1 [Podosphaera aphanis]|nr:Vacuolar cation-chloride cotransporter 1 [Podosphaera aphanis]